MSSETQRFKLDVITLDKADVYLSCGKWNESAAQLVKRFDEAYVRVVGDVTDLHRDEERVLRIMRACSGLVVLLSERPSEDSTTYSFLVRDLRIGAELEIPLLIFKEEGVILDINKRADIVTLQFGGSEQVTVPAGQVYGSLKYDANSSLQPDETFDAFLAEVLKPSDRITPYAFFVGRLERDFTQAREAIRTAVENEAGIPFLWADDGRHITNLESVRERTRLLLQHASFVVADLTLGVESPDRENPSRAHEIGMAIAYDRKLLLLSQEPRRYPYFSIGDLQMVFWSTESDLEYKVREWVRNYRDCLGRTIWNHRLKETGHEPKIAPLRFHFDPNQRYIGPKTPR